MFRTCLLRLCPPLLALALSAPTFAGNGVVADDHAVDIAAATAAPSHPVIDGAFSDLICHGAMLRVRSVEEFILASWICRIARIIDGDDLTQW